MPQAVESVASTLEQLTEQIQNLERRVAALEERREPVSSPTIDPRLVAIQRPRPPATWRGFPPLEGTAGAVSIVGKAVLGMAGAYLLRALAESNSIPKLPVLLLAIFYACCWMIWAARVHPSSRFASAAYAVTSALILAPLLWESTVRFQVISAAFASFWLVAFVVLALTLARKGDLQMIPWIATISSVATGIVLVVETRDLLPLTAAMLAIALCIEASVCMGHRHTVRILPALASSFTVWLVAYVMTSPEVVPEGYQPITASKIVGISLALMTIYTASLAMRGFVSRKPISFLDVSEGILAFAIGSFGVVRAGSTSVVIALGVVFIGLATACYGVALSFFSKENYKHNRNISLIWGLGLLLAGIFLVFPQSLQGSFLSLVAVGATLAYTRTGRVSVGVQASLFLAVAAAVSPLLSYLASAFAGSVASVSDWKVWAVGLSAALCYWIGAGQTEDNTKRRGLWLLPALLSGFVIAATLIVAAIALLGSRIESQPSLLSVVRTITNCVLALAFGYTGTRLNRSELTWAAYSAVGFGALKLIFEDLRYGNAASLVVSLLFYGLVLIILPRLASRVAAPNAQ